MTESFSLHPSKFSDLLSNALEFSSKEQESGVPLLGVRLTSTADGVLSVSAIMSTRACVDWAPVEGRAGDGEGESVVVHGHWGGTDPEAIDTLAKLKSGLMPKNGISMAVGSRVFIEIEHRRRLTVRHAGQVIGELADTGTEYEQVFETLEDWVELPEGARLQEPRAFVTTNLKALANVKTSNEASSSKVEPRDRVDVADVAAHPEDSRWTLARVGATFTAVLAGVDREMFAAGGPHGGGSGTQECLLTNEPAGA